MARQKYGIITSRLEYFTRFPSLFCLDAGDVSDKYTCERDDDEKNDDAIRTAQSNFISAKHDLVEQGTQCLGCAIIGTCDSHDEVKLLEGICGAQQDCEKGGGVSTGEG